MPTADLDDGTRLTDAGTIQSNIITTAAAYKLTGITDYRDRAILEMENAASFADWNPKKHFLDTSTIMYGMSLGYNWLYDDLVSAGKAEAIADAIYQKGIVEAGRQYADSSYCNFNWTGNKTNWNFVCNSSVIMASLALGTNESHIDICAYSISKALKSMEGSIKKFSRDGSWYEGTNYGQYAMGYFMPAMEAMRTCLGTDYDYGMKKQIVAFNDFIIYTGGARETFNFGDGGEALTQSSTLNLYSKLTGNKLYGAYRYNQIKSLEKASPGLWDIIWYNPEFAEYDINTASTGKLFAGIDTATFRNRFFGSVAFAGLHGGDNSVTHSHLDSGSFVYDVCGVRFASDLGQDNYNLPGYFNTDENAENNRWNYYRNRAESHNTIVINPDEGPDQNVNSVSEMIAYKDAADYGYAILDTTSAYSDDVNSSKRGIYFDKAAGSLLVQDEISLKDTSDVYWFMNFAAGANGASITVSDDGKSAVLVREGHRVWVGILSDEGTFDAVDCSPLDTSPQISGQASNSWYKKLRISLTGIDGENSIAVYMTPLAEGENAPASIPTLTAINKWN